MGIGIKYAPPGVAKKIVGRLFKPLEPAVELLIQYRKVQSGESTVYEAFVEGSSEIFSSNTAGGAVSLLLIGAAALLGAPITGVVVTGAAIGGAVFAAIDSYANEGGITNSIREASKPIFAELGQAMLLEGYSGELVSTTDTLGYRYYSDNDADLGNGYANYDPDADNDYSSLFNNTEITKPADSTMTNAEILQQEPPIPQLRPDRVSVVDENTGTTTNYQGISGTSDEFFAKNFADSTALDTSGIEQIVHDFEDGEQITYVNTSGTVAITDENSGTYNVNVGSLIDMATKGVAGFAGFMNEVVSGTISEVNNQSSVLIAQIVAGVIAGRDIEDVIEEIAVQAVAMGTIEATLNALGDITKDPTTGNITINNNEFGALLTDNALATEAIKGALTAVAVTAIFNGRDAGFEDYATAAASASVSRIVNYGITNKGIDTLEYTISDDQGGTVTKTLSLTVSINDAPVISLGSSINHAISSDVYMSSLDQNLQDIPVIESPDGQTVYPDAISSQRMTMAESGVATVTFKNSVAWYKNAIGWYVIEEDGTIGATSLLFYDAKQIAGGTTFSLGTLTAGTEIGFFVIANNGRGGWTGDGGGYLSPAEMSSLQASGNLHFETSGGADVSVYGSDVANLVFTYQGQKYTTNKNVFLSHSNASLNADGKTHGGAGWDSGKGAFGRHGRCLWRR